MGLARLERGDELPLPLARQRSAGSGRPRPGTSYGQGLSGVLATVGVVLDGTIPTNLGGATNEDVILGVTAEELHLWEDPNAPLLIRAEDVLANQLAILRCV